MKSKVAIAILLVTLMLEPAIATEVSDGDGLRLGPKRIRLWGIDAPELEQECKRDGSVYRCGEQAREALRKLLTAGDVRCVTVDHDQYGRPVARCSVKGLDLGAEMVRMGWAVDYRRHSHGFYQAQEREARRAKRGLWSGEFVLPSEWRRRH